MTVDVVEQAFAKWLVMDDPVPLRAALGAYASHHLDERGDPVWLMLVGGSGRGKTEIIRALEGRPDVRCVSSLSHESALLSGTPKREKASDATGGLLREVGAEGVLGLKDFTSILQLHREARAGILAALREVYDGHWSRRVGAEGGKVLSWEGRLSVIAGCTAAIDRAHAVTASMGERFVFVRLQEENSDAIAGSALDHAGHEQEMRRELTAAVEELFVGGLPCPPLSIDDETRARLIALVGLVTKARSPVERDYQGEIDLVLDPEAPTRITKQLGQLYRGCGAVGLNAEAAWGVVLRAGLDSIPKLRRSVLTALADSPKELGTSTIADRVEHPTRTTRRALEDLAAHGVALRRARGDGNTADEWSLAPWARQAHNRATVPGSSGVSLTSPETVYDDKTGTTDEVIIELPRYGQPA